MKFVAVLQLTDALEKITIVPPCRGYYTNLSIQNSSVIVGGGTSSETEKMDHMFLGVNVSEHVFSDIADVVGEGEGTAPYQPRIHGDIDHDGDHIYQKFVYPGSFIMQHKHWGKKRLRIRNDTDLLSLFYKSDDATPGGYILLQGNFIPDRGAMFKQSVHTGGFNTGDNWDSVDRFLITTRLAKAQLKVSLFVTYSSTAYQAVTYFRLRRHGDVEFADTVATPAGDVFDDDFIQRDNISAHGIIGQLEFQTVADQIGKKFETILNLGNVDDGDQIAWDTKLVSGTEAGGSEAIFTLAGVVPTQEWCEEAEFFDWPQCYDINKDSEGVYLTL